MLIRQRLASKKYYGALISNQEFSAWAGKETKDCKVDANTGYIIEADIINTNVSTIGSRKN